MTHHLLVSTLLPTLLAACAGHHHADGTDAPGVTIPDQSEFRMQVGDTVTLPDHGRLRYVRLVKDSRCPPDVQCAWAGDAIIEMSLAPAGAGPSSFELHTGLEPRSHGIGDRRLVLVSLERGADPAATLKVEAGPGP